MHIVNFIQCQIPETLYNSKPNGYSHIARVQLEHVAEIIHIAGQGGEHKSTVLAATFAEQCHQVFLNLQSALQHCQIDWNHIAQMTILVVDHNPEKLQMVINCLKHYFPQQNFPACTLIPIQSLALPNMLIEIDATAYRYTPH